MRVIRYIFDLIFPSVCFCCKGDVEPLSEHPLCDGCMKKLMFIDFPYCRICGVYLKGGGSLCYGCRSKRYSFDFSRSVFDYNDAISSIIKAYKYDKKEYLSRWLAERLSERFGYYREFKDIDLVSYVPSSKKKIKERGFDHIKLIAELFCKNTKLPLAEDAIESYKDINQVDLSSDMRLKNVFGKFKIKNSFFKGKKVLLIDDVATTLSTLNEVARVIKSDGAVAVFGYTLAREQV